MVRRTIKIDAITRVEGEGALRVGIRNGTLEEVELNIFEPPRFFEAFLRGRDCREVPDITARICGICPVAYQMSASQAMEAACGARVVGSLRDLRRLLYCGEWIESHSLHIHMLHAPDFLGYDSVIQMAGDHPRIVERGLSLKKAGNSIIRLLGGREIHPINVCVGGFYRVPRASELRALRDELSRGRDAARDMAFWTSTLSIPDYNQDYEFVSLRHLSEYPMNEGRIASSRGLDIAAEKFEDTFIEEQVPHSTALHSHIKSRGSYLTGPLARFALNFTNLPADIRALARSIGLDGPCRNPFQSISVRAIEVLFAFEEALRLINTYEEPETPAVDFLPKDAVGCWATEAPRGLLYHRYRISSTGTILSARIVPPTSQNQPTIESDLRALLGKNLSLNDEELKRLCERAIRNHDPCISCATHFLKFGITRT